MVGCPKYVGKDSCEREQSNENRKLQCVWHRTVLKRIEEYDKISRLLKAYDFTVTRHINLSLPVTVMSVYLTERGISEC